MFNHNFAPGFSRAVECNLLNLIPSMKTVSQRLQLLPFFPQNKSLQNRLSWLLCSQHLLQPSPSPSPSGHACAPDLIPGLSNSESCPSPATPPTGHVRAKDNCHSDFQMRRISQGLPALRTYRLCWAFLSCTNT